MLTGGLAISLGMIILGELPQFKKTYKIKKKPCIKIKGFNLLCTVDSFGS
jgi:hypothetical protein